MPEFGRATGGVINIVTKGGTNAVHGNVFGFLRHKSIQARNPFSVQVDPAPVKSTAVKQGYTRVQAGATLGGPIKKDKTFYFLSFETTRRQETGFTNIGASNFGLVPATTPAIPGVTLLLTPAQTRLCEQSRGAVRPWRRAGGGDALCVGRIGIQCRSGRNRSRAGCDLSRRARTLPAPASQSRSTACRRLCLAAAATWFRCPSSFVPLPPLIGNYPDLRRNEFLFGPAGSPLERSPQLLRSRQRLAVAGHRHPGQRPEPELRSERRFAHLAAADPGPCRRRTARHHPRQQCLQ